MSYFTLLRFSLLCKLGSKRRQDAVEEDAMPPRKMRVVTDGSYTLELLKSPSEVLSVCFPLHHRESCAPTASSGIRTNAPYFRARIRKMIHHTP